MQMMRVWAIVGAYEFSPFYSKKMKNKTHTRQSPHFRGNNINGDERFG